MHGVHPRQVPERLRLVHVLELQRRRVSGRLWQGGLLELRDGHLLRGNCDGVQELRGGHLPERGQVLHLFELRCGQFCFQRWRCQLRALQQR